MATGTCCDGETAALLAWGARAHEEDGDLTAGRRLFDAAYREAERVGDVPAMAEAALGMAGVWVHEHRTSAAAGLLHARLEHVLSRVAPDSPLALRVRVRLAAERDYRTGDHRTILALLDEARAAPDPTVHAEAASLAHHCVLGPDHGRLRKALADELVSVSAWTGRRSDLLMGVLWQVVDLALAANPHAGRRLGELRDLLAENDHLAIGFVVRAIETMLTIRSGRFDEAEKMAQATVEAGTAAGDADATIWYGAQLLAIRWYQGRLPELLPMLTDLVHAPILSAVDNSFFAALAVAAAASGDRPTAEAALAALRGNSLAELPRSSSWLVTMYGIVEAAHLLGNTSAAARAYELVRPFAHLPMTASLGVACFGSAHHALGVASLTLGEVDQAVTHFREAVHRNLALAHWPAVIASRLRFAEALDLSGRPDGARKQRAIAATLASALDIAMPGVAAPSPAPGQKATCVRQGRSWRIEVADQTAVVANCVGMLHLAVLIANPGVEIPAIDLVAGLDAAARSARRGRSVQPVLDRAAVRQYRQRLSEVRDEIERRAGTGDDEAAERARAEQDWILSELSAGSGPGGRGRAFPDESERARLAVGKAIRRALALVDKANPAVGAHLRGTLHTGTRCWYRPA